MFGMSQLM
jgi:hypothetical protein